MKENLDDDIPDTDMVLRRVIREASAVPESSNNTAGIQKLLNGQLIPMAFGMQYYYFEKYY